MILGLQSMQRYIGVFDISIIVLLLILIAVGALVGFFRIALKITNFLMTFLLSATLSTKFAGVIGVVLRKPIYKHFYNKVAASKGVASLSGDESAEEALSVVLHKYGVPKFIANFISSSFSPGDAEDVKDRICSSIASGITKVLLTIIAFVMLMILFAILFLLLRKFVNDLRDNQGFRIFDGILGVILMILIWFVIAEVGFFVLTLFKSSSGVGQFLIRDLRLESHKGFGLARWFYNNNLLKALWDMFF